MRTTITLEDDVAAKLSAEARKTGKPFKQVVNEALRTGLAAKGKARALTPFKIEKRELVALRTDLNYDKVEELFDQLDGVGRVR